MRALNAVRSRLALHPLPAPSPAQRAADLLGLAVAALALWATGTTLWRPLNPYDEGLLLTHADQLLRGAVPYRDFYSNYPPGALLLFAGLWKLLGVSPLWPRAVGLLAHLAIALLAGRLAARISGRRRVWLAVGSCLAWLRPLGLLPFAWLLALATALGFALATARLGDRPSRASAGVAGATLGLVSCFRHDLFGYLVVVLALSALCLPGFRRRALEPAARPFARSFGLGLGAVLLLFWGPVLALAGPERVTADLVTDQLRYVVPARALPLPPLFALAPSPVPSVPLPAFATQLAAGGVVLTLAGAGLAALVLLLPARLPRASQRSAAAVSALALAVLPQMLGRTDAPHALFTVAPALALACGLLDRRAARPGVAAALPLFAASALLLLPPWRSLWPPPGTPSAAQLQLAALPRSSLVTPPEADAERQALAFVERHTRPGEPIFVGLTDHRRLLFNDVAFYFLADRPGATRYLQFDPNLTTRAEVQQQMIDDLERRAPEVVILVDRPYVAEPNLSRRMGSGRLDAYLRVRYEAVESAGRYRMLLRRPG